MKGQLQIWTNLFSRWVIHQVQIRGDIIFYGEVDSMLQNKIHLKIAQIISSINDPISFIIHTGTMIVYFRASSLQQKVHWCKTLKRAKETLQQTDKTNQLIFTRFKLGKQNSVAVLKKLNTQLWTYHAELQSKLDQCISKIRHVVQIKSVTDKLRIGAQQFKFKAGQIMRLIEEVVTSPLQEDWKQINSTKEEYLYQKSFNVNKKKSRKQELEFQFKQNQRERQINEDKQFKFTSNSSLFSRRQQKTFYQSNDQFSSLLPIPNTFKNSKVFKQIGLGVFSQKIQRQTLPCNELNEGGLPFLEMYFSNFTTSEERIMQIPPHEPISSLQKLCEGMHYSDLLKTADLAAEPAQRMLYVVAFLISSYSVQNGRIRLPFRSICEQTFFFVNRERDIEFIAEQIRSGAIVFVRSDSFQLNEHFIQKLQFGKLSLRRISQGKGQIKLQQKGDVYQYNKIPAIYSNAIINKKQIQLIGDLVVSSPSNNLTAVIKFEDQSFWKKEGPCVVRGQIKEGEEVKYTLEGHWNQQLFAMEGKEQKKNKKKSIWKKTHTQYNQYYNFSDFTMQMNALTKNLARNISAYDSRYRPDIRALEHGQKQLAAQQYARLCQQENQRFAVPSSSIPKLFTKSNANQCFYTLNSQYWKQQGQIKTVVNIF